MKHCNILSREYGQRSVFCGCCSGKPQNMTHAHGTTASASLYYAYWICEFRFLCLIMMLVWTQKWAQNSTFKYFMNTLQIMNRWLHCHADLKDCCALEEEEEGIRTQLTNDCSKHSPSEGMRHISMQLPPIHKTSNVHFHVHYHVHKSPQMPQTSRDNSKIT
jgi:hypothetical protein